VDGVDAVDDATEHALDPSEGVRDDAADASSGGGDKNIDPVLAFDDCDAVRLCSFRFLFPFFLRFDFLRPFGGRQFVLSSP